MISAYPRYKIWSWFLDWYGLPTHRIFCVCFYIRDKNELIYLKEGSSEVNCYLPRYAAGLGNSSAKVISFCVVSRQFDDYKVKWVFWGRKVAYFWWIGSNGIKFLAMLFWWQDCLVDDVEEGSLSQVVLGVVSQSSGKPDRSSRPVRFRRIEITQRVVGPQRKFNKILTEP